MAELGLTDEQRGCLERLLAIHVPELRVLAIGSRARGGHRPGADLDLLLDAQTRLPLLRFLDLRASLSESSLPFAVDVVDRCAAAPSFIAGVLAGPTVLVQAGYGSALVPAREEASPGCRARSLPVDGLPLSR